MNDQHAGSEHSPYTHANVVAAARAEHAAIKDNKRIIDVGRAVNDPENLRLFRVAPPSRDLTEQPPGELYLAVPPGDGPRFRATVRHASPTEAVVLLTGDQPEGSPLHLFLEIDPAMVAKAFLDYLEKCKRPGLARTMLEGGGLRSGPPVAVEDQNPEQDAALGVIVAAGVAAVWGPPGTGKTRVIGAAVTRLFRSGLTVAVVSNTNVAVDEAILHVARSAEPFEPGEILRLGYPTVPEVSTHPHLLARNAVLVNHRDTVDQISKLEAAIDKIRANTDPATHQRLDELLDGHDTASLNEIVERRARLTGLTGLRRLIDLRRGALTNAEKALVVAGEDYDRARLVFAGFTEQMHLLEDEREVAALSGEIEDLERRLTENDRAAEAARKLSLFKRRTALKALMTQRAGIEDRLAESREQRDHFQASLDAAAAGGTTPTQLRDAKARQASTEKAWRNAKDRVATCQGQLNNLVDEEAQIAALAPLTEDEEELHGYVNRRGSVEALLSERGQRRHRARKAESEIRRLLALIEKHQQRLENLEESVVAGARVVATTLAQLVLHRGLVGRTFDHVVIDEASAALPPYVYAAMTKAGIGCTLIGDFEQNWPISRCHEDDITNDTRAWLRSDPFALLGIANSNDATNTKGCVTLQAQYRFGEVTTELANAIAYRGLLRPGRSDVHMSEEPEITIVDTSGLSDGATIQTTPGFPGRWWAAGAAVSYELALRHGFEGVGVVTPYKLQAQLTRAQMIDGGGLAVQVGTAHAFQGREFPVVVLDLVEGGDRTSWVAQAGRVADPWRRAGLRLFNVAVTRNAGRLFVVSNARGILASRRGPLQDLATLMRKGRAELADARTLLGDDAAVLADRFRTEQNSSYEVPEILSGDYFYARFESDVMVARKRLIIYSPFVGARRLTHLEPILADAVARGMDVNAYTKATDELTDPNLLDRLRYLGVKVVQRPQMHEKVVIIDDHTCYVGSLNVLSNTGRTGEIMLRLTGRDTISRIARWMS